MAKPAAAILLTLLALAAAAGLLLFGNSFRKRESKLTKGDIKGGTAGGACIQIVPRALNEKPPVNLKMA